MSRTLREAYQAHCDVMHILDEDALSYTEFLEQEIEHLRVFAEPLRHAIRISPPRDINNQSIVAVHISRDRYEWLDGKPEIPMDVGYIRNLLHAIYDDHPELKLPPYDA